MKKHLEQNIEIAAEIKILNAPEYIHNAAVAALEHAERHGDTSKMKRLLEYLKHSDEAAILRSLIVWLRTYSPMELIGPNIKILRHKNGKIPREFQLAAAREDPIRYRENKPKDSSPIIWRSKRMLPNGRVIDAHDYGLRAFPIRP